MKKYLILKDSFIQLIESLMALDRIKPIEEFEIEKISILDDAIKVLRDFGMDLKIEGKDNGRAVIPASYIPLKEIKLNPLEMLSLNAVLMNVTESNQKTVRKHLINKLKLNSKNLKYKNSSEDSSSNRTSIEKTESLLNWVDESLLNLGSNQTSTLTSKEKTVVSILDGAIEQEKTIYIINDSKEVELFPLKVLYLEERLCLISESLESGVIEIIKLSDIEKIRISKKEFTPRYSRLEIINLLDGIKNVNDNQVRIVIKVMNPDKVDLVNNYQLFSNPYMTTNPDGELIWAVSTWPNDIFYRWLFSNRNYIEILDPLDVKDQFMAFCKEFQKAS
jgi:hypothetical protein